MKKLRFLISLTTGDNDYQIEQAQSAEQAARNLGVEAQILYANNDAITQSTQILKAVQAAENLRPDAIIFEPVGGTALPQVARAAVSAGIGWAVLNRDASYIPELRKLSSTPVFVVTSDHVEIGRIQGRQFAALLPKGGGLLYILRGSLNIKKAAAFGKQRSKLAALNAADLDMIRGNHEDRRGRELAEFGNVTCVAIKNRPADARRNSGAGDLG